MKEERIVELKLQGILALLFFIGGGNLISQNGIQYPINDPRNPNCPCHKAQKLADDEFNKLLASANQPKSILGNLPQQKKENNVKHIDRPKLKDNGISEAEQEKINRVLNNDAVSDKNILDEGISEAEQENNTSVGNEWEGNQQLLNAQKDLVSQNANPVDQGVSFAGNEINNFVTMSNDLQFQQKFSSKGSSFSSRGSSSENNFKRRHREDHIKYRHHNLSHRFAKFKRRFDSNKWGFLKEGKKVASCYHWS
jgi:hypothetical protein